MNGNGQVTMEQLLSEADLKKQKQKEYKKKYQQSEKGKKTIARHKKLYNLTHKEETGLRNKKYSATHPPRVRTDYNKQYRQDNKNRLVEQNANHYYDNQQDILDQKKKYRAREEYKISHRAYLLKKTYGLEEEPVVTCCNICGTTDFSRGRGGKFHIDHDHVTGQVRGFLCNNCNHLLGNAKDNPEILAIAIAYLQNPPFQANLQTG